MSRRQVATAACNRTGPAVSSLAYVAITLLLLICGSVGADEASQGIESDAQNKNGVAARVDGEVITVEQINQLMSRGDGAGNPAQARTQDKALEQLIDQRVLVRQARTLQLDGDPRIIAALEAYRRTLLAQAYLEQIAAHAAPAEASEVKAFYAEHPELFADRRVYRFREMAIVAGPDVRDELKAELDRLDQLPDKAAIMPQLANWLRERNLRYKDNATTQAAEQLPMELLPAIHRMKDGDLLFIPRESGFVISQLETSQSQPLEEEQAKPYIEQFLLNRRRLQLAAEETKRLRDAASIEYVSPFTAPREKK